jgi:hypothetical protein
MLTCWAEKHCSLEVILYCQSPKSLDYPRLQSTSFHPVNINYKPQLLFYWP